MDCLSQNGIGVFVIVVTSFVPNMVTNKKNNKMGNDFFKISFNKNENKLFKKNKLK